MWRFPKCALGHTGVVVLFCEKMGPGLDKVGHHLLLGASIRPLSQEDTRAPWCNAALAEFGCAWHHPLRCTVGTESPGGAGQEVARPRPGSSGPGTELTRGKMEENTVQVLNGPDLSWTY